MNQQFEFMNDALHVLAQPVTALRTALELGLSDLEGQPAARKVFEDCLGLLDRLTQDLAVFREIAALETAPPLEFCDGEALLKSCVEEMNPVAEAFGVPLRLSGEGMRIECNAPLLQRAVFLLLDELIAGSPRGGISIRLSEHANRGGNHEAVNHTGANEAQFELCPGIARGRRQQLIGTLLQFSGGSNVSFDSHHTCCRFRTRDPLQFRDEAVTD